MTNYMFLLPFLNHPQVVTVGYFKMQLALLLVKGSNLHKSYNMEGYKI